jgi:hypothetical protein
LAWRSLPADYELTAPRNSPIFSVLSQAENGSARLSQRVSVPFTQVTQVPPTLFATPLCGRVARSSLGKETTVLKEHRDGSVPAAAHRVLLNAARRCEGTHLDRHFATRVPTKKGRGRLLRALKTSGPAFRRHGRTSGVHARRCFEDAGEPGRNARHGLAQRRLYRGGTITSALGWHSATVR